MDEFQPNPVKKKKKKQLARLRKDTGRITEMLKISSEGQNLKIFRTKNYLEDRFRIPLSLNMN